MAKGPLAAQSIRPRSKIARRYLKGQIKLADFRAVVEGRRRAPRWMGNFKLLTPKQRQGIVQQAIMLLEGFYAHLPIKRAMYAVDPVQRLRRLQHRLHHYKSDLLFHAEMTDIFQCLCDRHTRYSLPAPFIHAAAWLPFKVESYRDRPKRRGGARSSSEYRYLVAHLMPGLRRSRFREGVEVLVQRG